MKKIIVAFLNIIFAFCFLTTTGLMAKAEGTQGAFSLEFRLTANNGRSYVEAQQDDVITVSFTMQRSDADESYTMSGFQNYIHYDLAFFEFVEDSIVCYDTAGSTAKKQNSIEYGEIIQCQSMGKTYASEFVFCTFQLKVISSEGVGTVYNGDVFAFDTNNNEVAIVEQSLEVLITDCLHGNKTKVPAKEPTCHEDGWDSYWYCPDCEVFFDASGEGLIESVPFIPGGHSFSDVLSYNENGHWYECSKCGELSDVVAHNGGTANCQEKAVCKDCGQEYGEIDEHHHVGETYVKNKKQTYPWRDGYSGDVYCCECDEFVKEGKSISQWNIFEWPWWMILIALILLPLIILLACFFSLAILILLPLIIILLLAI